MKKPIHLKNLSKAAGLLVTGLLLGWLFFGGSSADTADVDQHIAETHTNEEGDTVYTCSMHPQIRKGEAGNCPICGMELIPVSGSQTVAEENPHALTMTPVAMKLANVATTPVVREVAVKQIRMPGKVAVDERKISVIPAHFSGRVEALYVNFTGAYVEKGDKLASVYSPELITAQKELLQAYRIRNSNPALYRSARQKLENWEITDRQIEQIIQAGEPKDSFTIHSSKSGYVLKRNIAVGDHIAEGHPMFRIADLSSVWVLFQANENDLLGLDTGDKVHFRVESYPGREFEAKVTYIDPILNKELRTVSVRTEINNETGLLKPNMLASGIISATLYEGEPVLLVPESAVMWTGKRSMVYVKKTGTGQPVFEAREVVLGPGLGDSYVIREGLKAGEEVVVQGNFMIDAAAQLSGKPSMMNREPDTGGDRENNNKRTEMEKTPQKAFSESGSEKVDQTEVPEAFRKQLVRFVDAYLTVKNALVQDDLQAASSKAAGLGEALSAVDMNLIRDDGQMQAWMTQLTTLKKHIKALEQVDNLAEFRRQFALLSETLAGTLTTFGVERNLYVQFCPMALDMKGAYWVSKQVQIANPYMGQKMPSCGEIKKEIKPDK